MDSDVDFAVIEMGASGGGEIGYLCSLARPHIALINNVQQAHIEGFGSIEGVASAKGEIYSGLRESGTAVLNIDEIWTDQWRELIGDRRASLSPWRIPRRISGRRYRYWKTAAANSILSPRLKASW